MYAILCTDGLLSRAELAECVSNSWCPIAVQKIENDIHIPLFKCPLLAKRFKERNIPKNWLPGTIKLHPEHLEELSNMGYILNILDYPHKIKLESMIIEFPVDLHFMGKS